MAPPAVLASTFLRQLKQAVSSGAFDEKTSASATVRIGTREPPR
jgi:hypothetical protein